MKTKNRNREAVRDFVDRTTKPDRESRPSRDEHSVTDLNYKPLIC